MIQTSHRVLPFQRCLPVILFALTLLACNDADPSAESTPANPTAPVNSAAEAAPDPESLRATEMLNQWTGDLPGMVERRLIRALVPWSDSYYYLDGIEQKGIAFEATRIFDKWLNEEMGTGARAMRVVVVPVRRDHLLDFLVQGYGDIALGGITITPSRREMVDFSDPTSKPMRELVLSAPSAAALNSLDDLAGKDVHVRPSSSYWNSLGRLSASLEARGLAPINRVAADEYLSTEDLMRMVDADLIPYTVADEPIAQFWIQGLDRARLHTDLAVREGAHLGWALRKNSPELLELLNRFVAGHKAGTLVGNVVINRYLKNPTRLQQYDAQQDGGRLQALFAVFQEHAAAHDFDTLMVLAQGYQESRLDQSKQSHRGAVGVMQLLPTTAADPVVGVADISTAENNIMAGVRYLAWIRDTYLDEPGLDDFNKTLFAFASYNAGPARIKGLRREAAERGLNPDTWFNNVELMAAEKIGRETVEYVSNIYAYYVAFTLMGMEDGAPAPR